MSAVAEPPQREAEERPHVPPVKELEGLAVALADPREQVGVAHV
jgi:hypothetical protein